MTTLDPAGGRVRDLPPEAYADMTRVLRIGLAVALGILASAVSVYAALNPSLAFSQLVASNPVLGLLGLTGFVHGLATGQVEAYLTLGVFALLATPIARVLTGAYFFGRNGEREVATIALTVALLLLVSLLVVGPLVR